MWAAIWALLQALAAFIKYKFDPEMIKRQDEINKQVAEDNGYDSVNKFLAGKDSMSLSVFISEFLRRVHTTPTDSASGRIADLLLGELPKRRSKEDRDADTNEGLSG